MESAEKANLVPESVPVGGTVSGKDRWAWLSRYTTARIAIGRAGGSLRTRSLLDFRLAHARARDAVHAPFDPGELSARLTESGLPSSVEYTAASDRSEYLKRPDLGRRLSEESRARLAKAAEGWGRRDLVVIVSDGLAAQAALRHAVGTLVPLMAGLKKEGWSAFPVFVVPYARVKLQDEVGELLGARHSLMLLGERPGLGSPDSLGAYFTYRPRSERTDADRNCLSNIRAEGLEPGDAAAKLLVLLKDSASRKVSGVALKDLSAPIPALKTASGSP